MKHKLTYRIAITGPESTGKTELAEQLARHYKTVWVPDYSRRYLNNIDRKYEYDDILAIARGQYASEELMVSKASGLLFCDTDFIVNLVWCMDKFGKCHPWILEMIDRHPYGLYLLCDTDVPWKPDPLRENPDDRERLFRLYKKELESIELPFSIISGKGKDRIENAIRAIEAWKST